MLQSRSTLTWGIVLLAFGALVLALLNKGITDRSRLTGVVGQLKSLEKSTSKGGGLGAVRFALTNDPRDFQYISKAGNIDEVWSALQQAGSAEISLLIDSADSHSPLFEKRTFYMVYEIRVGGSLIRSYPQVAQSWKTNDFVGKLLGYASAVSGVALLLVYFLCRRQCAGRSFQIQL